MAGLAKRSQSNEVKKPPFVDEIETNFREWEKKMYPRRKFPITCEFCKFVGGEAWHCKNPDAGKFCINVFKDDICEKWIPNEGLMTYLYTKKVFTWFDTTRLKELIKGEEHWGDKEGRCIRCRVPDNLVLGLCGDCHYKEIISICKRLIKELKIDVK